MIATRGHASLFHSGPAGQSSPAGLSLKRLRKFPMPAKVASFVKNYCFGDCAVQAWVLRASGLEQSEVELAYIDTSFAHPVGG